MKQSKRIADYIGMGTVIGFCSAVGILLGAILGNLIIWLLCGAAIGVVIGAIVEMNRKKNC